MNRVLMPVNAGQKKGVKKIGVFVLVYLFVAAWMPIAVLASSPVSSLPQVTVPHVSLPEVHLPQVENTQSSMPLSIDSDILSRKENTSASSQNSSAGTDSKLAAKDVFKQAARSTLGSREVLYNAAKGIKEDGTFTQGGWKTTRSYAYKTISPWLDAMAFDQMQIFVDAEGLLGQGKNVKNSYDAYKAITSSSQSSAMTAPALGTAGRSSILGASFPILGGTVGIISGSLDISESLSDNLGQNEIEQTAKFYSGIGSAVSGLGSILGGAATIAAGASVAPILALVGTVLLGAGLVCAAAAFGLKYSATFRNSRVGRGLTGVKDWFASRA